MWGIRALEGGEKRKRERRREKERGKERRIPIRRFHYNCVSCVFLKLHFETPKVGFLWCRTHNQEVGGRRGRGFSLTNLVPALNLKTHFHTTFRTHWHCHSVCLLTCCRRQTVPEYMHSPWQTAPPLVMPMATRRNVSDDGHYFLHYCIFLPVPLLLVPTSCCRHYLLSLHRLSSGARFCHFQTIRPVFQGGVPVGKSSCSASLNCPDDFGCSSLGWWESQCKES